MVLWDLKALFSTKRPHLTFVGPTMGSKSEITVKINQIRLKSANAKLFRLDTIDVLFRTSYEWTVPMYQFPDGYDKTPNHLTLLNLDRYRSIWQGSVVGLSALCYINKDYLFVWCELVEFVFEKRACEIITVLTVHVCN